jgi:hypothetical protein
MGVNASEENGLTLAETYSIKIDDRDLFVNITGLTYEDLVNDMNESFPPDYRVELAGTSLDKNIRIISVGNENLKVEPSDAALNLLENLNGYTRITKILNKSDPSIEVFFQTSGGSYLKGAAYYYLYEENTHKADGRFYIGGQAEVVHNEYVASGVVNIDGSSIYFIEYAREASGTAYITTTSVVFTVSINFVSTIYVNTYGHANYYTAFDENVYQGHGTIRTTGAADREFILDYFTLVTPIATFTQFIDVEIDRIATIISSAIATSGQAEIVHNEYVASGRVEITGQTVDNVVEILYVSSGPATFSGSTIGETSIEIAPLVEPTTILITGHANYYTAFEENVYEAHGTIYAVGDASREFILEYDSVGLISLSGISPFEVEYLYFTEGNVITSGSSTNIIEFSYVTSGSVTTSGSATTTI